jgi:orotate phosphoribosyltransferase
MSPKSNVVSIIFDVLTEIFKRYRLITISMVNAEVPRDEQLHSEGLTPAQEKLANLYIETKTAAKVGRRRTLPDGKFELYNVIRPMGIFDFAQEDEFALKLHEKQIDAPLSPYYVNQRNLPQEVYKQIGAVLTEIPSDQKIDFCTGIPDAGTPIAKAYAEAAGVSYVDIFAKEQTEAGRRIVGTTEAGQQKKKIRIIDDLVTAADTKIEAIKAAEALGYEVVDIVVIIDREQGGSKQLAEKGYELKSAFTITQLLDYYLRTGKISKEKYDESKAYLETSKKLK